MGMALLLIGVALIFFCNGAMVVMVVKNCDEQETAYNDREITFAESWNEMVHESQDKKLGKVCMRTFYFIPQIIATVSKIHPAYQK